MGNYKASDILGMNLTAQKDLTAHRNGITNPDTFIVSAGDSAGVVYSYTHSTDGSNLWWEFLDMYENPYFIKHEPDAFDIGDLTDQGVKDVATKTQEAAEETQKDSSPVDYYLKKYGKPLAIGAGVLILAAVTVKAVINRNKS